MDMFMFALVPLLPPVSGFQLTNTKWPIATSPRPNTIW